MKSRQSIIIKQFSKYWIYLIYFIIKIYQIYFLTVLIMTCVVD